MGLFSSLKSLFHQIKYTLFVKARGATPVFTKYHSHQHLFDFQKVMLKNFIYYFKMRKNCFQHNHCFSLANCAVLLVAYLIFFFRLICSDHRFQSRRWWRLRHLHRWCDMTYYILLLCVFVWTQTKRLT